jgi:hypothetical protein
MTGDHDDPAEQRSVTHTCGVCRTGSLACSARQT